MYICMYVCMYVYIYIYIHTYVVCATRISPGRRLPQLRRRAITYLIYKGIHILHIWLYIKVFTYTSRWAITYLIYILPAIPMRSMQFSAWGVPRYAPILNVLSIFLHGVKT